MADEKDCDALIGRLFQVQQWLDPDRDPGDLHISVQDDIPLVTATQHKGNGDLWYDSTIVSVLTRMVEHYESQARAFHG